MRPKPSTSLRLKKSLGQNFLNNLDVVADIIAATEIKSGETVLEVGPGDGILTQALLDAGANVIAVEKDDRLIGLLQKHFPTAQIISGDILKIDICKLIENCKLKIENFKIVANIPYYITGQFLRKVFESEHLPSRIVLMLQKEVAERIVGGPSTKLGVNKESILSISVKAYGTPSIVGYVGRENFRPAPNVDSAILLIEKISRKFFQNGKCGEKDFFGLVKKGFAHKRKKLSNNLKLQGSTLKWAGERRAEELTLDDWRELYYALQSEDAGTNNASA